MKSELKINGTQEFMGLNIPVVLGGFGEGKKCISDKTIAEIHNQPVFEIRRRIGDNIKRFSEDVDFIDMKQRMGESQTLEFLLSLGYAKQSITQARHIYILSERGYAKLIKIMDTDYAWEVHDKLIDEYFALKELIDSIKSQLLLIIYEGGPDAIVASRDLVNMEVEKKVAPLRAEIEENRPLVDFAIHVTASSDTVDVGEFSKIASNEHIDIGRNKLFEWLRSKKYLMNNNLPYQSYIDRNWFEVVETVKQTAYGPKIFTKTLITGKGQVALIERLRKETKIIAS